MKKAAIAMSGGVDSTVAALLLREQGYDVRGFFLRLAQPDFDRAANNVRRLARAHAIRLEIVDASRLFKKKVLDYFAESYLEGLTPNPCAVCNRHIKFGLLLEHALAQGMNFLATGHYARIVQDHDSRPRLLRGVDPTKDQSYFLARLKNDCLQRIIFPHGERSKKEVYRLAQRYGLPHTKTDESQDVCFLKDAGVEEFFAGRRIIPEPGDIVDGNGRVLGRHRGLPYYTIGQRRGLGVPDATPYYVGAIDKNANRIVVCKQESLAADSCELAAINWLIPQPVLPLRILVQTRYRQRPQPATLRETDHSDRLLLSFDTAVRSLAPGQFAVFYNQEQVIGSGCIRPTVREGQDNTV